MRSLLLALTVVAGVCGKRYLAVENGEFHLNGEKIFQSGMNIAWNQFGADFGNGQYDCCTGSQLEKYIRDIASSGGNSIRIWLHCDGWFTPEFGSNGHVIGPDETGTLIKDLAKYLDVAYENNILVNIVLWNGATSMKPELRQLILDEILLQSYIDEALIPMVQGLAEKVSLGAWEIMNEPEGSVSIASNNNPCFDTSILEGSGAGWTGENIPMENFLRFINRQAGAIKRHDPKALVTLGSWCERPQTDSFGYRDYYKDKCLIAGGGDELGVIDFYQMHSYAWQGSYANTNPLMIKNNEYGLDKPNVIGEFSQEGSDGRNITELFEWAYTQGYSGAWSWQANAGGENADDFDTQARGTRQLEGRDEEGEKIDIELQ